MKKHNYSAGPCILPQEVFKQSAQSILDFNNSGLSILEISHRSKDFVAVMEEARALVIELLGLEGKGCNESRRKSRILRYGNLGK
jgi:phosphoserine aminotransferase